MLSNSQTAFSWLLCNFKHDSLSLITGPGIFASRSHAAAELIEELLVLGRALHRDCVDGTSVLGAAKQDCIAVLKQCEVQRLQ